MCFQSLAFIIFDIQIVPYLTPKLFDSFILSHFMEVWGWVFVCVCEMVLFFLSLSVFLALCFF